MARTLVELAILLQADTSRLRKGLSGVKGLLAGTAAGIAALGVKSLQAAAQLETNITALENLASSAEAGRKLYEELVDFAARTPFETQALTQAAQSMLGFGISAEEAGKQLKQIGAIAGATGGDLQRVAVNFAQIQAAGKATARDLREFVNQGIPIFDLLAESTGKSVAELQDMTITATQVADAFALAGGEGGKFADAMIAQSNTVNGLVSTLKSQLTIVLQNIGQVLLPAAKEAALLLRDAFGDLIDSTNELGQSDAPLKWAAAIRAAGEVVRDWIRFQIFDFKILGQEAKRIGSQIAVFFEVLRQGGPNAVQAASTAAAAIGGVYKDEINSLIQEQEDLGEKIKATFSDTYKKALVDLKAIRVETKGLKQDIQETEPIAKKVAESLSKISPVAALETRQLTASATGVEGISSGIEPVQQVRDFRTALEELNPIQQAVLGSINQGLEGIGLGLFDMVTGAKSVSEGFKAMGEAVVGILKDIIKQLIAAVAKAAALALIGALFGIGELKGFVSLLKGFLGGVGFLQHGGLVTGPGLFVLGEKEPELVIPLSQLGNFGQPVVLETRIRGNDLFLVHQRTANNTGRRAGPI